MGLIFESIVSCNLCMYGVSAIDCSVLGTEYVSIRICKYSMKKRRRPTIIKFITLSQYLNVELF